MSRTARLRWFWRIAIALRRAMASGLDSKSIGFVGGGDMAVCAGWEWVNVGRPVAKSGTGTGGLASWGFAGGGVSGDTGGRATRGAVCDPNAGRWDACCDCFVCKCSCGCGACICDLICGIGMGVTWAGGASGVLFCRCACDADGRWELWGGAMMDEITLAG